MSRKDFDGFEYTLGSVTAWRSFNVDRLGRLIGITHAAEMFKPGENVAHCASSPLSAMISQYFSLSLGASPTRAPEPEKAHDSPGESCHCGYYAWTQDNEDGYEYQGTVNAVVEAYGRVLLGTRGLRAEKMRLVALQIPKSTWNRYDDIRAAYPDVPIYARRKRMMQAHPITSGLAETDPWPAEVEAKPQTTGVQATATIIDEAYDITPTGWNGFPWAGNA